MAATPSTMLKLGTRAPEFELADFNGIKYKLENFKNQPLLVMFISNHCPFVKHVSLKIGELGEKYQNLGVHVVAIMSNNYIVYQDDSPEKMKNFARKNNFTFPYLVDETQKVAKAYKAACTPDFFLFDSEHKLVYRGQMDGSRPGNKIPVTGADLTNAVENMLAGKPVSENQVPSIGCNIKWTPGNEPDYFG